MNLLINEVLTTPIDQLINLYRQGYTLESGSSTEPSTLCSKCNKMKNMATGDMSSTEATVRFVLAITLGSLIYYNLGKWESKKLGWE